MSTDPLMGEIAGPGSGPPLNGRGVTSPSLSGAGRRFLSDILVELGFVDEAQADHAVEAARHPGQTPEKVLLESGAISEDQLARALAERYGLDHIDLTEFPVDESAAALLRKTAAKRYLAAPVGFADDGALVLAVADPADSLGLSDIAVMTKLPVRPAVAARSQINKLLDALAFMEEPAQGASESVSTVIVPPDGAAGAEPPSGGGEPAGPAVPVPPTAHEAGEGELVRLREELALSIAERDQLTAKLTALGEQSASAAEEARDEATASLRVEHERELAAAEAAAEEALRAERTSAQQALSSLRAKHDEALDAERAKRVKEVESERERTVAAIDAERGRNQNELEALRARLTEELESARGDAAAARRELAEARAQLEAVAEQPASDPADAERIAQLERLLASSRDQLVLTADADRRAESARAALAALRDESERQAQIHALTERQLRTELDRVREELEQLRDEVDTLRALS